MRKTQIFPHIRTIVFSWILMVSMHPLLFAQRAQQTVSMVLKPPYTSRYSEFENLSNRIIITVINDNIPKSAIIHGVLTNNDQDKRIETRMDYATGIFNLAANETKVIFSDFQQLRFLGRNNTEIIGFSSEEWNQVLMKDMLPEGNWELCISIKFVGPDFGVTDRTLGSACFNFNITRANAPILTSPYNGQVVPAVQPNIAFSWTPPIGNTLGAQIVYDLYVVKVMADQNPNDAINAAISYKANNPLIKNDLIANQYVTQPFDLPLDTGHSYAVQVIARDVNKQVGFQNDGRSEASTFTYGAQASGSFFLADFPVLSKSQGKKNLKSPTTFPVTSAEAVPISVVSGRLHYKFKEHQIGLVTLPQSNQPNKPTQMSEQNQWKESVATTPVKPTEPVYNKEQISMSGTTALGNVKVSLVLTYLFTGKEGSGLSNSFNATPLGKVLPNSNNLLKGDEVIATTTTKADGSFSFQFVNTHKDLGLHKENWGALAHYEFENASGTLFKVLRLKVENKYYCSPDVNIKLKPWEGIDLGDLVSYVKSYNLKVQVASTTASFWDMGGQGVPMDKVSASVIRKSAVHHVPSNEADSKPALKTSSSGKIISEKITDKNGEVFFRNLVMHDPNNQHDRYYVKAETNKTDGVSNFKTKEKRYSPIYDQDYKDFPFNSVPQNNKPVPKGVIQVQQQSEVVWNSHFVPEDHTLKIELYPDLPRIAGKVEAVTVGAKPLSNENVVMVSEFTQDVNKSDLKKVLKVRPTDANGRYSFENLEVETKNFQVGTVSAVEGPTRKIIVKVKGFNTETRNYPPLKWGQQIIDANFQLVADGQINGYVVDEDGNPIASDVQVDSLAFIKTKHEFTYAGNTGGGWQMPTDSREAFRLRAPSGNKRKLHIKPHDSGYGSLDTIISIDKVPTGTLGPPFKKFVVYKAKKRVRFMVAEKPAGKFLLPGSQLKAVSGAQVTLLIPGNPIIQKTGIDGYVTFVFESAASQFDFTIEPPENTDFEIGHYTLSNIQDEKVVKSYPPAYLNKAARISGIISLGTAQTPLAGATVYIDLGGGNKLETTSGSDGKYELKGVARNSKQKTIWASKPGETPNITSQSQSIEIKEKNELNFNLQIDNELLIEDIYGFSADVKTKEKQPDGSWLISGSLINLPENENFTLQEKYTTIPFTNLKIVNSGKMKSGVPIGVPDTDAFYTDLPFLKLLVHNAFGVLHSPQSGDLIQVSSINGSGIINGVATIQKSSFQFSKNYLNFSGNDDSDLYITSGQGASSTTLTTMQVGAYPVKTLGIADSKGSDPTFNIIGFKAKADKKSSKLEGGRITLATILMTNDIPGMNPKNLEIQAGNLIIYPEKFEPLSGNTPLKFKLEKWDVTTGNWFLNQTSTGITIPSGTIKTGVVDIPIKDIVIKPSNFEIGEFELNNLSLASVVPLKIMSPNPSFGYNNSVGSDHKAHWELRIITDDGSPAVAISGLPGMKSGDEMKFQSFSLISNGEQSINSGNQKQIITFYDVLHVQPISFSSGDKYFDMQCAADLEIPQVKESMGRIRFSKPSNTINFALYPLNVSYDGPGGVRFSANMQFTDQPQQLIPGKFVANGTITDKEGINLKGVLQRTTTAAWMEVNPKNQIMPLGGGNSRLMDIEGDMLSDLKAGNWMKFSFSGIMHGFTGIQDKERKNFIVHGSITADNEKISVKNIPSAFGGIGLTYDVKNARFTGDLQLDKAMGPLEIAGTANLVVDGAGWYFLAGGKLNTPGLGEMSAGLLIGDYNYMPGHVSNKLMFYAYNKNVPASFKSGVSGFFFTGEKDVPIINIPDFDIDLGFFAASLGAKAGLDARLWMGFSGSGNEYGIGAMAFAYAYFKASSITCTKLSAEARAEMGLQGIYNTGNGTFSLKGCGSITIGGSMEQCFPTPCLSDGICCTGCIGGGVSEGIKVDLLLDSQGNTDLSFGFGNCSGQTSMTSNW